MISMNTRPLILFIFLLSLFFLKTDSNADVFKYKDDKGVWHFTDTPAENNQHMEKMASSGDSVPSGSDLSILLNSKLKPKNDIEKATLATVLVKSPMGTGSGFFISRKGFIITNSHVLYGDEKMIESMKKKFEHGEAILEEYKTRLEQDKNNIEAAKNELEDYRQKIEKISDHERRSAKMEKYNSEILRIESYEREYNLRKDEYERVKNEMASGHSQLSSSSTLSGLAKSFEITLADGSQTSAELIDVSKNHDLALLKISGIKNAPALVVGSPMSIPQSAKVFAIGNPIDLRNSVVDGIVSGFEGEFVKTSAKIYPGNSGGPLVDESGKVIGINTMKLITHKFEGLGFAIKIDIALNEFSSYINN